MKIKDIKNTEIINNLEINSKFISSTNNDLNLSCNILTDNFYLDSHNYFPLTDDFLTFSEAYIWGDLEKYKNFYSKKFIENFSKEFKKFKELNNIYLLGTSSVNNYYRNIITFLPRLFFINEKKIKLGIHRNTSNKIRIFIEKICNKFGVEIKFVFLDDNFFKFTESKIPQFLNKSSSIKILNSLKKNNNQTKEKIYISRQNCNFRNLLNERDVIIKLKKLDYKIVDLNNFEVEEQIKLFSSASVVVSPTGSGLTNLVFCNPGTKVFEITPKYNFEYEAHFKNRYSSICKFLDLNYTSIDADSVKIENQRIKTHNKINSKIITESNYYKDLILKMEKINKVL